MIVFKNYKNIYYRGITYWKVNPILLIYNSKCQIAYYSPLQKQYYYLSILNIKNYLYIMHF